MTRCPATGGSSCLTAGPDGGVPPGTRIVTPCWSRPALVRPGEVFRLTMNRPPGRCRVLLSRRGSSRRLRVSGVSPRTVSCLLPSELAPGPWNINVEFPGGKARERKAVWSFPAPAADFHFLHTSDFHVCDSPVELPGASLEALEKIVEAINNLAPDFILDTGDLVSRYGAGKQMLPPSLVAKRSAQAATILSRLEAPVFLVPGNHDFAFPWSRRAWSRNFGHLDAGACCDYSFNHGNCRFVSVDASVRYDKRTGRALKAGFTSRQLAWLEGELAAAAGASARILFFHYDYGRRLAALLERGMVNALVYGHSRPMTYGGRLPPGVLNANLSSRLAFQRIIVERGRLRVEDGPPLDRFAPAAPVRGR